MAPVRDVQVEDAVLGPRIVSRMDVRKACANAAYQQAARPGRTVATRSLAGGQYHSTAYEALPRRPPARVALRAAAQVTVAPKMYGTSPFPSSSGATTVSRIIMRALTFSTF